MAAAAEDEDEEEDVAHGFPLIKTQLTRFEDEAEASRVQPIINIHYLSRADREDRITARARFTEQKKQECVCVGGEGWLQRIESTPQKK